MNFENTPNTGITPLGINVGWKAGILFPDNKGQLDLINDYRMEFHTMPNQSHEPHPSMFNQEQQLLVEQEVGKVSEKEAVAHLNALHLRGASSPLCS